MVDQPQWNVSIGGPTTSNPIWWQSFTCTEVNCKLSKIAFRNSGSNNGVRHANVIIRRGEGIDGDILYQDTWEFGNRFWDEYEIPTNVDINLTNGEKYTIQLESPTGAGQTQPSLMGRNSNVYSGGHFFRTGYNVYGDATFRVWVQKNPEYAGPLGWQENAAGTITITNCPGNLVGPLVIPDTINGIAVTEIGNAAFQNCTLLTSIIIPNSVTHINNAAFQNCYALVSINIPDGVNKDNYNSSSNIFQGCRDFTVYTTDSNELGLSQDENYSGGLTTDNNINWVALM